MDITNSIIQNNNKNSSCSNIRIRKMSTRLDVTKYQSIYLLQPTKISLTRRSIELNSSPLVSKSADNANPPKLNPYPAHLNPQRSSIYTK
ncbi:hypothetical protein QL285_001788 [Trifolium repens]|nr:hypothetical protein QL285_001788 [Trifolium repens]